MSIPRAAAGPLTDVRVVELGGIGPSPFCAMVLADLGAAVTRVQRVSEMRAEPNPVLDRGRRSIAVDIKSASGRDVVLRLVSHADVLLEGFRPGVLERLKLGPAELHRIRPELVIGRMTGFGQEGPLAQRAGHDINYIAQAGVLNSIGRPGDRPVPPLNLVGDFGGGGMLLAVGVLAAVHHARRTGEGQEIDAAMIDGAALLMAMPYGYAARGDWSMTERGTNRFDGSLPYYDTYECADGRFVAVGALEPVFFRALVEKLGVTDQVDVDRQSDPAAHPGLRAVFAKAFASATREEWTRRFNNLDACVTPVLSMAEAQDDAHVRARGTFVADDAGVIHPAPAPRFSLTPSAMPTAPPLVGANTDEVLAELDYTPAEVAALRREGVVA